MLHAQRISHSQSPSRNAIQVKNIGNTQVGHVSRQVASKLAPLLDRNLVTVEGIMRDGNCKFLISP